MIRLALAVALLSGIARGGEEPVPVLDDPSYRFCHVDGASAGDARAWCEILESAPEETCPGLRATCEGAELGEWDPRAAWEEMTAGCRGGGQGRRAMAPPPEPPDEPMRCDRQPPESSCAAEDLGCDWSSPMAALGTLVRWVAAFAVAGVLLIILRLILRYAGRRTRTVHLGSAHATRGPTPPLVARDVPDQPSDVLLSRARCALEAGRPGEALLLARAAALRGLGEVGRLRLHRSRTDREYVRQARRDPEVRDPLAEVVVAVEAHRWGGRPATPGRAAAVVAMVERLLGAVAAVALLWTLAPAEARGEDRFGPWGDAGVHATLDAWGHDVSWRLRGLDSLEADVDVLILDAEALELGEADWASVRTWVEAGGLLLVGGQPPVEVFPELGEPVSLTVVETKVEADGDSVHAVDGALAARGLQAPVWPGGPGLAWVPAEGRGWVFAGEGRVAVQSVAVEGGHVLAVADGRLLCNGALVHPDNEAFLGSALYLGHDLGLWSLPFEARVQLATRAGETSDDPLSALSNARLLPLVAQLLALLAVVALWLGWPFAPLRDPPGEGRLSFADHLRAVGARYRRLRATRHALSAYADLWLQRLGPQGVERAAARAGYTPEAAAELVARLQEAAADPAGPRRPDDLDLVEELWRITRP